MGRGVSCGGGQSSLGYLFGSGESAGSTPPKKNEVTLPTKNEVSPPKKTEVQTVVSSSPSLSPAVASSPANETSANVPGHLKNNYLRADGQNCGNFITDRPSTKVHAAPGGGSSLGYLFGDNGK